MFWDIDQWVTIEEGPLDIRGVNRYSSWMMHGPIRPSGELIEAELWPQRRMPWN